jgi:3-methyladenine DNA glycosylase AlkC
VKKIPQEIIDALNSGQRESSNLMEFLAVDIKLLLKNVLPEFDCPIFPIPFGVTKKHRLIGRELQKQFGFAIFEKLKTHKSDTIRTFACYLLGEQKISFAQKLELVRPLADDGNSGVREWAWIVLRDDLLLDLDTPLKSLVAWTSDSSDNIRRFASELTRPRSVWCKHIAALRARPWLGLPILLPLYSDPAKYVQLSVGNWLNDAGKDHPTWVINLCREWQSNSPTTETNKICKRAMRNLPTL